jgi:hypothetical protein
MFIIGGERCCTTAFGGVEDRTGVFVFFCVILLMKVLCLSNGFCHVNICKRKNA